jgi:hypothetical protein
MAANTLTGEQLLDGVSEFMEDVLTGTTTAAGTTSTLEDSSLAAYGKDALADGYIRITSGTAALEVLRVKSNTVVGVVTVDGVFSAAIASGVTYEFHQWAPAMKYRALDRARIHGYKLGLGTVVYDETLTGDGETREFDLPSGLRQGPFYCYIEDPIEPDAPWNILSNPLGTSLTNWTVSGSGATAALYADSDSDLYVPKYEPNCTRITIPATTAVTYLQTVDALDITAAQAAGRTMTYGLWVYAREASRVQASIEDDDGVNLGTAHQGLGWEFIKVTIDVSPTNATTLTMGLRITSDTNAMNIFWEHAFGMYGSQIPSPYQREVTLFTVRRDGTVQRAIFEEPPEHKRQIRLVGRGTLTALSGSATATMELDEVSAELLYAVAAKLLLVSAGISSDSHKTIIEKANLVEQMARQLTGEAENQSAREPTIVGPHF